MLRRRGLKFCADVIAYGALTRVEVGFKWVAKNSNKPVMKLIHYEAGKCIIKI